MNRPERASSEPSMEEILASIRKIIAEEPNTNNARNGRTAEPVVAPLPANPLLKPANASKDDLPLPSFGRLADALRGPAPNGAPPAAPKPVISSHAASVIDDDLADLLQEPFPLNAPAVAVASAPIAAKAEAPAAAQTPSPTSAPAFAPAVDESWAVWRSGSGKPASSPLGAPNAEAPMPAPVAAKRGFFPPAAEPKAAAPAVQTAPAARSEPALSGLNSAPQEVNGSGLTAAHSAVPEAKPASTGPVVIAAMPRPSAAAVQAPAPVVVETRVIETVRKPVAEEQATVPLPPRQIVIGAPVPAEVPELAKSEADTSAAGATALGVLAAGLAVASAQPPPVAAPQAAAAPAVAPAAPATPAAAPVRSLEDAVAEMLRPMLQQWLTDHMPRIIEKALKIETAPSVKDASK